MSATDAIGFERLEALLRGDTPRTRDEFVRASLFSELRDGTLRAPGELRERVLAAAPKQRVRLPFSLPSRRLVLVIVPLAVAGAVTAAIVHGFVGSGSNNNHSVAYLGVGKAKGVLRQNPRIPPNTLRQLERPTHAATKGASTSAYGPVRTHTFTTGSGSFQGAQAAGVPEKSAEGDLAAGTVAVSGNSVTIPKGRLVHADATLEVQVSDHAALTRATNNATQIVTALGGYTDTVQYTTSRQGYGNAYLTLRVPVGKAQTAIMKLGSLGRLDSEQVSTQDLQQQLTQQTNGIGTLRREIAVYEQALASGTLSATDRVDIQIKLENAQHSLTQLRKVRSGTVAFGKTADISLTLTTNKSGIVPGGGRHHKQGRLGRLLHSSADFLGLEGIIVLYALVVLSPFIVLGGLAWAALRERRRRDERRLLAST